MVTITPCPDCGAPTSRGRCAEHPTVSRGTRRPRLYDRRSWRDHKRVDYLRRHPMCEFLLENGKLCGQRATEVDHVIPLEAGGPDVESNYQSGCKPHHSAKTARESSGWGTQLAVTAR